MSRDTPSGMKGTMKGFFVVPRAQRERASVVHLALLAHRDLLALAMRGARAPQDLRDLPDLPPSLALTDRVRTWSAGLVQSLRAARVVGSSQLDFSCSCQCSWSSRPTWPPRSPRSHGRLCWGKCPVGQGLTIWSRGGEGRVACQEVFAISPLGAAIGVRGTMGSPKC